MIEVVKRLNEYYSEIYRFLVVNGDKVFQVNNSLFFRFSIFDGDIVVECADSIEEVNNNMFEDSEFLDDSKEFRDLVDIVNKTIN